MSPVKIQQKMSNYFRCQDVSNCCKAELNYSNRGLQRHSRSPLLEQCYCSHRQELIIPVINNQSIASMDATNTYTKHSFGIFSEQVKWMANFLHEI